MRIELTVDGKTYKSIATDDISRDDAVEALYEELANINKFKMELEDGTVLLLPVDVIRRAHIIIYS